MVEFGCGFAAPAGTGSAIAIDARRVFSLALYAIIFGQWYCRLGLAGTGTCNYGGVSTFRGPLAVDFCDQLFLSSTDATYQCDRGSMTEFEYKQDSGCTGTPTRFFENINDGVCDASDTGCNLYLVRSTYYLTDDCTGTSAFGNVYVVTDGAANQCTNGIQFSNIDLNGFTITSYSEEDCGGFVNGELPYINNGCGALTNIVDLNSVYTEISEYPGPLYEGVAAPMNYQDAQDYCENSFGTELATINSAEENEEARRIADEIGANGNLLWIGLNRLNGANAFDEWDDESDVDYTNFYQFGPGIVNGGQIKDCIAINGDKNDQWVPRTCNNEFPFVCNGPNGLYGNVPKPF